MNHSRVLRAAGGQRGFTLLEILVTIALLSLLSAVLITGAGRLLSDRPVTPEDIFRKTIEDARQEAVLKNVEVRLSWDSKAESFKLTSTAGETVIPVTNAGDLMLDFVSNQKNASAIIVGGEVVETETLPYVTFFPDGTCVPFKVQIRLNGYSSRIAIDPWTCAPMLEDKK